MESRLVFHENCYVKVLIAPLEIRLQHSPDFLYKVKKTFSGFYMTVLKTLFSGIFNMSL